MNAPNQSFRLVSLRFPGSGPHDAGDFEGDVLAGLSASPKSIPCKYLYDAKGSALFDQICELPEYYPTRTELALTRRVAPSIAASLGEQATIIEPGAGSTTKIRILLDALEAPHAYLPVDISGEHLRASAQRLRRDYPELLVQPVEADFTADFEVRTPAGAAGPRVVYFPGSTIGNFEPEQARELLASFAAPLRDGDFILLGWDRIKAPGLLVPAYADAAGVTAAFIKNLLVRVRDELAAELRPEGFALDTRWQPEHERIRISLRAQGEQAITLGGRRFDFAADEELFVEHSHKFSDGTMADIFQAAGLREVERWTDPQDWFALSLLSPVG